MKDKDIQRDIKRSSNRQMGDSHELGKLSRVRGKEQPPQSWERGRGRRGNRPPAAAQSKAYSQISTFIIAGVGSAIIAICLGFWIFMQAGGDEKKLVKAAAAGEAAAESPITSPSESEAIAIVKRTITLQDPKKITDDVRLGASKVDEVLRFFSEMDKTDGKIIGYDWLSSKDQRDIPIEAVGVTFEADFLKTRRLALLTPNDQGIWQLDFDSFARIVSPSWEKILSGGVGKATVRVLVGGESYYNGPFTEEAWSSFGMGSPDIDESLYGYCKKGSAAEAELKDLLSGGVKSCRVTLEIQSLPGGGRTQFEITKVLVVDWVLPGESPALTN